MFYLIRVAVATAIALSVAACATVDQFGARVKDANTNSQDALNEETLLNILRASVYQPLNFVAISQITGTQAETLSTGFPNIILSPGKAVDTGPYQFTNSLSSGVSGGFQSNPLVSTDFENGLLSPLTPREVALLLSANPRDPVLFTVVENITLEVGNRVIVWANHPSRENPGYSKYSPLPNDFNRCQSMISEEIKNGPSPYFQDDTCSYSRFASLLNVLIADGLTVALITQQPMNSDNKAIPQMAGSATPASSKITSSTGAVCFDAAVASSSYSEHIQKNKDWLCNTVQEKADDAILKMAGKPNKTPKIKFILDNIEVSLSVNFRSLSGIYGFLGETLRTGSDFPGYESVTAKGILNNEKFITILDNESSECFVSTHFGSRYACIPSSSYHSAAIVGLLEQIRNLSIQPADLNSAFTVRVQ